MDHLARLEKLRGIADCVRGSSTEINVSREDAAALAELSGKKIECEGRSTRVAAKTFVSAVDAAVKKMLTASAEPAEPEK